MLGSVGSRDGPGQRRSRVGGTSRTGSFLQNSRVPKKRVTAGELLRQLESDPKWVAARQARERKLEAVAAASRADQAGLVAELQASGYPIETVWDFVNNAPHPVLKRPFLGPYVSAYPTLVRHLRERHLPRVREGIVRALTVSDGGSLVADALFREFTQEEDPNLRWVLANALRTAMPYSRRRKHPEIKQVLEQFHGPRGEG